MTNFRPGYLVQGQPLGMNYNQVLLTADNTNIDPTLPAPVSMLQIGSDNTTSTTRTFTLSASPLVGHRLLLYFYTGASTTCELADSGTAKLTTTWSPLQYDVLELVSDGTYWNELCRGNSTGVIPALTLTNAHLFVGNGSNVATDVVVSGDISLANTGAMTIANLAVTNAKVAAAAAIDFSKLAALADGNILVGSGATVPTSVAVTGDITITNAGVTAIGANKLTVAQQNSAVMAETTVTLTQALLLAIGTPVSLVAAAGAGKVIVVDEIEILHTYATAVYATGSDLSIEYETAGTDIVLVDKGLVTAAASKSVVMRPTIYDLDASTGTSEGFDVTAIANKGVQVTATNFTLGDAANILKIKTRYHVKTLLT